jgi:hypothetical protein
MKKNEKAEIWGKKHFDKLLNTKDPKELIKTGNKEISEVEVEEITIDNIEKAIRNSKNKASGTDRIYLELIKYGGYKLLNNIYELVRQIRKEERRPAGWKETIIVPIHKTGDRDKCENYREWH